MHRFVLPTVLGIFITSAAARRVAADLANDFSTNPLTDPQVLIQGPDAPNAASRFTYDDGAQTLTAHYDTTAPTIKLVFPLPNGQHFTQDSSFTFSATFKIASVGHNTPATYGAEVPSFGLINTSNTGSTRASTGYYPPPDFQFTTVSDGTANNILTFDYFPTLDNSYGGNSINLTNIKPAIAGADFFHTFGPAPYVNDTLPFDQTVTVTVNYDGSTGNANVSWGGIKSISASLKVSDPLHPEKYAAFDVNAFAITLWNDPNLAPAPPADAAGEPVGGDVIFDSFIVQTPEPSSLCLVAGGAAALLLRRRRA